MTPRRDDILLDALLGPLAESMREVGLPLHILLENRFGDLNENQAEMIEAARLAADSADAILRRVQRVRALEAQPRAARDGTTRPLDLLRGALAIANAREAHRGVRVEADLSPALPRVRGDRSHLEEALTLVLIDAGEASAAHRAVTVRADEATPGRLELVVVHGGPAAGVTLDRLLASRLLEAEGASIEWRTGETRVELPTGAPAP